MLQGKYEAAKGVVGNALNNGKAKENDASTTVAAISPAQVSINGQTTDTSKAPLTDSNGKIVSSDTSASSSSRVLAKPNVPALQDKAQQQQVANRLLVNTLTVVGDKFFVKKPSRKS